MAKCRFFFLFCWQEGAYKKKKIVSWCYYHSIYQTWTSAARSQVIHTAFDMDSLTLSIWQGRGICGPWVLAAGSTLAAGCLGHTCRRGGFEWRTASPVFGLFVLLFLLLSIFFILQWTKARHFIFQSSQRIIIVFKTDCHSPWLFSFVFSLFHPYRQAILFDLPWPIHHICHRDKTISWIILSLFTRWTINNPFSLHEQL